MCGDRRSRDAPSRSGCVSAARAATLTISADKAPQRHTASTLRYGTVLGAALRPYFAARPFKSAAPASGRQDGLTLAAVHGLATAFSAAFSRPFLLNAHRLGAPPATGTWASTARRCGQATAPCQPPTPPQRGHAGPERRLLAHACLALITSHPLSTHAALFYRHAGGLRAFYHGWNY